VWFIYPETANVRLEDMNSVFGDGTSVMPSPATIAEAESLFSSTRSPVASMDLNRQRSITADNAIPGLDIDPPAVQVKDGRPVLSRQGSESRGEGLGGWISSMVRRTREDGDNQSGSYKRLGQEDQEE
jgi:hypothetical protein